MAEKSWLEKISQYPCFSKGYCSILGLKIALTAGIFMVLPTLFYLIYHEYWQEGINEFFEVITYPPFLLVNSFLFVAYIVILSKILILPLKKFELHISELEKGEQKGPFDLKKRRFDEIGYIVSRFNSLHKIITDKIESKDTQIDVIHDFTKATSGVLDIPTLMDNFFMTLRTALDFDIGVYIICHNNHTEGKIYSTVGILDDASIEKVSSKFSAFCPGMGKDTAHKCHVSVIDNKTGRPLHSNNEKIIELPVMYFGDKIGTVAVISNSNKDADEAIYSRVFTAMAQHASIVVERLLTHILAEEKKLSKILSSMSEGVYLIDKDGHAMSVNQKGMELVDLYCNHSLECVKTGFDPNLGKCPHPVEQCEFSNVLNRIRKYDHGLKGKVHTEEIKNYNGQVLQLSISQLASENGDDSGYVVTAKDVTEDRLLQKRVMVSSKLAALGEMAAGIAHEVNNPLQVMLANLEQLEDDVTGKGVKRVEHIKDGIFRIKGIVRDLLIFAREQTTDIESVEINNVLEKVIDIMHHQLRHSNVAVELDLDKRPLFVKCNKNLFQQVIINLLQNAKDAIEESAHGTRVLIRTGLMPGNDVFVEVSDDGPGIQEKILDRIFDPFFTTKDVGKGTGLGLSVSRRIIEGSGGTISVASSKDRGTKFTITLPLKPSKAADSVLAVKPAQNYKCLSGKSVIIVDDEKELASAIMDGVKPWVSSVEAVHDGISALERIMENDYDLILLDIRMPGMNGMELYREINENKPYLAERILFLTGDTLTESTESFIKLTRCDYLAKPFTIEELLKTMCKYEMGV